MKNIFIIAGTSDSKIIIKKIEEFNVNVTISVTTNMGENIISRYSNSEIITAKLNAEEFMDILKVKNIDILIDVSHPFAFLVSQNAKKACCILKIKYFRFLRKNIDYSYENLIFVDSYEEAAVKANNMHGNILLTTGAKTLDIFTKNIDDYKSKLHVRIFDFDESLNKCLNLGINKKNIITVKGVSSTAENIKLIKKINAKVLIAKESGIQGGQQNKIDAAKFYRIPIIIIKKPNENGFENIDELINLVKKEI